jgi:hypothetical protein
MAYVYGTPPTSPNRKLECPWAPNREGNSNKVIIPFQMTYQENGFSTPRKRRRVNPNALRAPKKQYEGSLLGKSLDDVKKVLFPGLAAYLRERINEKRKLKAVKSSEYPGAPKKVDKRKSNQRDLNSTKKSLFVNKEISPYSRTLLK